jgi:pimeloyl-ACP methyl ester carboxylesterase
MAVETCEANGLTLAYETFGDPRRPPLVLIMGLGVQMLGWPDEFCALLAEHRHVIRFDNRDVGESTHLDAPKPDIQACLAGDTSSASYKIDDMALDAVGLLDALAIDSAHVVGASLGGMIAQTVAVLHPERVRSLTSIMSTTGAREVSQSTPEAAAMLVHPPARSREEAMDWAVRVNRVIGSPAYPSDEGEVRDLAARSWDRAHDPAGFARQFAAILASRNRTEAVRGIRVPTLVIHGEEDPLVPVAGGRATADAIEGAELHVIPGMGHNMPRQLWPQLVELIVGFGDRAQAPSVAGSTRAGVPRP